MLSSRLGLAVWLGIAAWSGFAEGQTPTRSEERWELVDGVVQQQMVRQGLIGVAVGIIEEGRILGLRAYGLADREANTPVTTDTVFNWASNSKPVAAVAAMQLVEQGRLDLDADIHRYLPEFPPTEHVLTMRKLLCHQSGMPHYTNGRVVPTVHDRRQPLAELNPVLALDRFNRSPLLFPPGTKVSYSSYAYVLVSAVIQAAGGEPYADQVDRRIVRPLGLKSFQLDLPANGQPHWSAGYVKSALGTIGRADEDAHFWKHGAGGYKSNIADFARWAEALLNRKLVTAETERLIWTRQPLADGTLTTWGLGFTLDERDGLIVSHNGSQDETKSRMVLYPRDKRGVVVLCNCSFANLTALAEAVERVLAQP